VPYLCALEVCSRQDAIQIQVYLTLPYTIQLGTETMIFPLILQTTSHLGCHLSVGRGRSLTSVYTRSEHDCKL